MIEGTIVIDCQFGSTGKGLIAGWLARRRMPDTVVTAWSANAGHTYIGNDGRKFIHTMLANGVVSPALRRVMIGPGSLIDPATLAREMADCEEYLRRAQVFIHPSAAVITQAHRDEEAGPMNKIGSTKKGCGAAAIERIRRNPNTANVARLPGRGFHPLLEEYGLAQYVVDSDLWQKELGKAEEILIEGAQGHSLSMYHGFYPYVTSRDVSVHQTLADCGVPVPVGKRLRVVGTVRTYPIRVSNRYNDAGEMVGTSGPCYPDQEETTFEELGQPVELTTVTKLPRRVFTFSEKQVVEAVKMNGVNDLFVNFLNYLPDHKRDRFLQGLASAVGPLGCRIRYLGLGPSDSDVVYLSEGVRGV